MTCPDLHTPEALALELAESTEPARLRERLEACPDCARAAHMLQEWSRGVDHPDPLVAREVQTAWTLSDRLLELSPEDRAVAIRADLELQSWGLACLLLERSSEVRTTEPRDADELAQLAVTVAASLDETFYGPAHVADLRARTEARAAEAAFFLGERRTAERAIASADALAQGGLGRPGVRAEIRLVQAELAADRFELEPARRLAAEARELFRRASDPQGQVRAGLEEARIESLDGCSYEALDLYESILSDLPPDTPDSVRLEGFSRLTLELLKLDDPERITSALAHFPAGGPPIQLYHDWLEALLAHRAGDLPEVEDRYRRLRQGFLAELEGLPATLVSLDLVQLLLESDRPDDAREAAEELYEVFACPGLQPAESAAVVRFLQQVRRGQLDLERVEALKDKLLQRSLPPDPPVWGPDLAAEIDSPPPA